MGNRRGGQYFVPAVLGWTALDEVADRYRGCRGIESNHRILGQAMARTSSRSPELRVLQIGVGKMLQDEWVILKLIYASEGREGPVGFVVRQELLRFANLLQMLPRAIGYRLGPITPIENRRPPPARHRRQGFATS
ncbi:MAG: hypothetical protein ACREC5_03775 [Thermoplasmata archaeon]